MQEYTETQKKILEIGKKEFLSKGFNDASLRGIVKEAGYTQGAFYGYYPDKESLFDALVAEVADDLMAQFRAVQDAHFDLIPSNRTQEARDLSSQSMTRFVNYIYDHLDAFKLIVCHSDGTKYASYIHDLVELDVARTEEYYAELRRTGRSTASVSFQLHHMISSAYFAAVFETVAHNMTREQALHYVAELSVFFSSGWDGLLKR